MYIDLIHLATQNQLHFWVIFCHENGGHGQLSKLTSARIVAEMEIDAVRVEVVGRLDDVVAREHPRRRALRALLLLTLAPAFLLLGLLLERRQAL